MTELLKQPQYEPASIARQVVSIFAGTKGYLDDIPIDRVVDFERSLLRFLDQNHADLEAEITKSGVVSDAVDAQLRVAIEDFKKGYA
jgi:F-type H+-transporting ATPase subunit alpha